MAPGGVGCLKWHRGVLGHASGGGMKMVVFLTLSKSFITDERCYHPDIVWNWIIKTQDLACGCWLLALCSFSLHCSPTHVTLFFAISGPTKSMSACLWFELQECGLVFRKHPQTGSWNFEIWFILHYVSNVKKNMREIFFWHSVVASRWRVCYQRGLPRLVVGYIAKNPAYGGRHWISQPMRIVAPLPWNILRSFFLGRLRKQIRVEGLKIVWITRNGWFFILIFWGGPGFKRYIKNSPQISKKNKEY